MFGRLKYLVIVGLVLLTMGVLNTANADEHGRDAGWWNERERSEHYEEWDEHEDEDHEEWDEDDDDEHEDDDDESDDEDEYKGEEGYQWNTGSENAAIPMYDLSWDRTLFPDNGDVTKVEKFKGELRLANETRSIEVSVLATDDTLLIPLNQVSRYLDANVYWHPEEQVIEVRKSQTQLLFKVGKAVCYENGAKFPMPEKTLFVDGITYIPASVLFEGLGFRVDRSTENPSTFILWEEGQ